MNKIVLDGREIKVGDVMWDLMRGEVKIMFLGEGEYPIISNKESYMRDGRCYDHEKHRSLYWSKPADIIPPRPPAPHPAEYWPVDAHIFVRNGDHEQWRSRHFARYRDGIVYAWDNGRTSFTIDCDNVFNTTAWYQAKLAEGEK